ncbi:deoxyribose-phosphate aldolase [Bacteriovorax sp. PP10]|uniref:Deoxyribose-phosphate aldolase n=1 Tax=Bacteriovorax antarcticus TaxID=3088717 RepID=A0ABU5VWK0_9BACT|nr:deoxyribose-phosphate aldolase [Bacteriovorax sp. PP10]MEA9356405.1 deoxyribose-phosphate aldolase [Bacteriovorax sp. PP10]
METATVEEKIARSIDHTLLKPDATITQIHNLIEEAKTYRFFSVCVNPSYVATCAELLKGSGVQVCTVVGFPLGANSSATKAFETAHAIKDGADEIDMVINIGALKSQKILLVEEDIRDVVAAAEGKVVKVIIETSLLTDEEKVVACQLAEKAGAKFVKTSTGFNGGGATIEDITLMKESVSTTVEIKASGGIKDLETAKKMLAAGATRLGTSAGVAIIKGFTTQDFY